MPSVSPKQQRFFGLVLALKRGTTKDTSPKANKVAGNISESDAKDFAGKRKREGIIRSLKYK